MAGSQRCPDCGAKIHPDGHGEDEQGWDRLECSNDACNEPVWFSQNGAPAVRPWERRNR